MFSIRICCVLLPRVGQPVRLSDGESVLFQIVVHCYGLLRLQFAEMPGVEVLKLLPCDSFALRGEKVAMDIRRRAAMDRPHLQKHRDGARA